MKYYEKMQSDENLGWCKPILGSATAIAINNGNVVMVRVAEKDFEGDDIPSGLELAARRANPDYDCYKGYDNLHIYLDGDTWEGGCSECPWRDECEAMINDEQNL